MPRPITRFQRDNATAFLEHAERILAEEAARFGLRLMSLGGRFTTTELVPRWHFHTVDTESGLPADGRDDWEIYAPLAGLRASWFGAKLETANGEIVRISGYNPRKNSKFPILTLAEDGRTVRFSIATVLEQLGGKPPQRKKLAAKVQNAPPAKKKSGSEVRQKKGK